MGSLHEWFLWEEGMVIHVRFWMYIKEKSNHDLQKNLVMVLEQVSCILQEIPA